jgi:glycosyltransferase involved in cell wall biosynthesis
MNQSPAKPRVAIVADWIIGGGAERVVHELHRLYPEAPIYASYCSTEWRQRLDNKVITGYLQHWPFSKLRKFVGILRIGWYRHLNFKDYDVVISTTGNGEAKHIRVPAGTKYICYCFTPVHYYWAQYDNYLKSPGFGIFNPLARLGLTLLVRPLRKKDYAAAQQPDQFIALSTHIQQAIKKYYNRDSVLISPPVDTERFAQVNPESTAQRFVTMGRQIPFKRTDVLIEACNQAGLPLTVIGNGPEHAKLEKLAGPSTIFLTNVTDQQMPNVLRKARAFLFAAEEDFGIAPVEAMAAGLPVIAYRGGGALDYVEEGKTGLFFDEPTAASVRAAIHQFEDSNFKTADIKKQAARFSQECFRRSIQKLVTKLSSSSEK